LSGGDQALNFVYLLGCLVLVGSALVVRRLPIGQTLKMLLAWGLIFAAIFAVIALKDDFLALGGRLMREVTGAEAQQTQGGAVRIRRSDDGHYWADAALNGRPVRFLIDSGASNTVISRATADAVGIAPNSGFGVIVDTANGTTMMDRGQATTLKVGPIERIDVPLFISRNGEDEVNVIGMSFLSTLSAWGVEGRTLVLRP
jgi:aspartyl protease family protein